MVAARPLTHRPHFPLFSSWHRRRPTPRLLLAHTRLLGTDTAEPLEPSAAHDDRVEVVLARLVVLLRPVEGRPYRHSFEQAHRVDVVVGVAREAVVDPLWQRHQIAPLDPDADPLVIEVTHLG